MKSAFKLVAILVLIFLVTGIPSLGKSAAQGSQDNTAQGGSDEEPYKFVIEEGGIYVEYIYDTQENKIKRVLVNVKAQNLLLKTATIEDGVSPVNARPIMAEGKIILIYRIQNKDLECNLVLKVKKNPKAEWLEIKEIDKNVHVAAPSKDQTNPSQPYDKTLKFNIAIPETSELLWKIALFTECEGKEYQVDGSEGLIWVRTPTKQDFEVTSGWESSTGNLNILFKPKNDQLSVWDESGGIFKLNVSLSCNDQTGKKIDIIEGEIKEGFDYSLSVQKDQVEKCQNKLEISVKFIEPKPPEEFSGLTLILKISQPSQSQSTSAPSTSPKGGETESGTSTGGSSSPAFNTANHTETVTVSKPPVEMIVLSFIVLGVGLVVLALGVRSYWDARDYSRTIAGKLITASLIDNPVIRDLKYKPSSLIQLGDDPLRAIVGSLQEYDNQLAVHKTTIARLQNQLRQKDLEINSLRTQLEKYRSHRLDSLMRDLLEKARRLSSYGPQAQSVSTLVNDLYRVYSRDMTGTSKEVEVLRLISSRLDELISLYQREALKKSQLREAINQKISAVESQLELMRQKLSSMAQNYHIKLPRSTLKLAETFLERAREKLTQDRFEEAVALTEAAIIVLKELDAQLKNTEYLSMLRILREKFWSV